MGRALNVIGVPTGAATFTAALEGLTALDEQRLRANPGLPPIYESGVVYNASDTTQWRDVEDILAGRKGPKMKADCEALAPWRAAELRVSGEDPLAQVLVYPSGVSKFHAIVLRGNGTLEDPSAMLGMKTPPGLLENYNWWNREVAPRVSMEQPVPSNDAAVLGFDEDAACCGIDADPTPGFDVVTFELCKTPDGCYRGQFRVPFLDGRALFGLTSTSETPEEAERKATAVLGFVGSVWDDLAALAPTPGAKAAIDLARNQHVQNLAKAAYGKTKSLFHRGGGGGSSPTQRTPNVQPVFDPSYDSSSVPAPGDDQQPLADTDAFHGLPPGGDDGYDYDPVQGFFEPEDKRAAREEAVIGWINAALVSGSRPATRSGGGRAAGGGGGFRLPSFGGGGGGAGGTRQAPQQQPMQPPPGYHAAPAPMPAGQPAPYSPTPYTPYSAPAYAQPGGGYYQTSSSTPPAYGGGGFGGGFGGGGMFGRMFGQGRNQQQQGQQQQQQGGGGGGDSGGGSSGGGGSGSGGGSYDYSGETPTPGASFVDPETFFGGDASQSMGAQAFQDAASFAQMADQQEQQYASPESFFGE